MNEKCPETGILTRWLTTGEDAPIESHLAACDDCRKAVALAQLSTQESDELIPQDAALTNSIMDALPLPPQRSRLRPVLWAAAAAALLIVGILLTPADRPPTSEPEPSITRHPGIAPPELPVIPEKKNEPAVERPVAPAPEPPLEQPVTKIETPDPEPGTPPEKPKVRPTVTQSSVAITEGTGPLKIRRGGDAWTSAPPLTTVHPFESIRSGRESASFLLDGKNTIVLAADTEIAVHRSDRGYVLRSKSGRVDIGSTTDQEWFIQGKTSELRLKNLNGKVALELNARSLSCKFFDGKSRLWKKGYAVRVAGGETSSRRISGSYVRKLQAGFESGRPKTQTAFAAFHSAKEPPAQLLTGRVDSDGVWVVPEGESPRLALTVAPTPDFQRKMILRFQVRCLRPSITIGVGDYRMKVDADSNGTWIEVEASLDRLEDEGVPILPGDEMTSIEFSLSKPWSGRTDDLLEVRKVHLFRRER